MKKELAARIKDFNKSRDPAFLQLKYKAMRDNKYRFFRGTAHLFFEDLDKGSFLFKAPRVWLCGDLHLENFGSYKGDNRVAYFNINDFDESLLGSPLLDLARLMTSVYIASGSLKIKVKDVHALNDDFIDSYFQRLGEGYIRVLENETANGVIKKFLEDVKNRKRKDFIKKRTITSKGTAKLLIDGVRTFDVDPSERKALTRVVEKLKSTNEPGFFKVLDVARRAAGTSSLGLKRYVVLVKGHGHGLNYLLDVKEAAPSCLQPFVKIKQPAWTSEAERVIEIQKRFISDPPALLQSVTFNDYNFVLKELQPLADRINYNLFEDDIKKLGPILVSMAAIYAWSNLRAGGRQGSAIADELIHFAKEKEHIKKELKQYAYQYSKKTGQYYKDYCKAFDKGFFN